MANNYNAEVVRYFRRKTENGYDEPVTYLGAEQRFVNALRNSGVNNLEEQFIIGTDTYTTTYVDNNGNTIIEKSFCKTGSDPSATSNYYKLVTTKFANAQANEDYYFDNSSKTLKMPNNTSQVIFGDGSSSYPNINTLYGINSSVFILDDVDDTLRIFPPSFAISQTDELYFVKNGSADLPVLTKNTGEKYITESGIEKRVIKETIINNLV